MKEILTLDAFEVGDIIGCSTNHLFLYKKTGKNSIIPHCKINRGLGKLVKLPSSFHKNSQIILVKLPSSFHKNSQIIDTNSHMFFRVFIVKI
jgi:hypothetical protein